ncbi:MAG: hypothetical protein CMO04_10035, partial [Thalassospira sp.]|uniref:hypothetical protein n=1 Tax=Thalassospira sp. TaxID=1912094 RepID=UPI000C3DF561
VLPKNNPHAARFKSLPVCGLSVAAPSTDDGCIAETSLDEDPNHSPEKSSVLQAPRSGNSAAAANQPFLSGAFFFLVAALIFTLHLMIILSA